MTLIANKSCQLPLNALRNPGLMSVSFIPPFLFQDFAMKYWRDNGTPVEKLMMGFAAYGRTFRLTSSNTGIGAPASGAASAGPYTREAGFWSYYEVTSEQNEIQQTVEPSNGLSLILSFRSAPSWRAPPFSGLMSRKCPMPARTMSG